MTPRPTPPAPVIDPDRCVRGALLAVSCAACAEACPSAALTLNPDGDLTLDAGACTGCGACAAACGEGAATIANPPPAPTDGGLLLICHRHPAAARGGARSCVHGLGLADLARLHGQGARRLAVATGDCAACALRPETTLERRVADFNRLALSRGLAPLAPAPASPRDLRRWRDAQARGAAPDPSRRAFLRRLAAAPAPAPTPPDPADLAAFQRIGARTTTPADRLFAHVPRIDPDRCAGCDSCTRVCPHGALTLVNYADEELAYETDAALCTGCGLCADVCDVDAVEVTAMAPSSDAIALTGFRCRACGATQHAPGRAPPGNGLCRICARANHHERLFVVLE